MKVSGPHDRRPHGGDDPDEDLRALLHTADPAADLPALDPAWTTWKVRQTMSQNIRENPSEALGGARPSGARPRRRRTGIIAGLGAATAAAIAAVTIGTSGAAVTALTLPPADTSGPGAMCAVVTSEALAQRESAFEARVTSISDGQVTLEVTERFKGDVEDEVTVPQPATDLGAEFSPGQFTDGGDYLISADDGRISVCGQSGPASPELRTLYQQAFTG